MALQISEVDLSQLDHFVVRGMKASWVSGVVPTWPFSMHQRFCIILKAE